LTARAARPRVHLLDLHALHRGLAVADAEHLGDRRGGDLVVAGDHRDADAAAVALLDRLDRLLARRVEQADQAEQHQVARQVGGGPRLPRSSPGFSSQASAQHPLALPGELVRGRSSKRSRSRGASRRQSAGGAVFQDHFRRALDEQHLLAVAASCRVAMNGARTRTESSRCA
jgi:hypothetical protein